MTTREKVLLSICLAATIGGGAYYASGSALPEKKPPVPSPEDYTELIKKVQFDLRAGELTSHEKDILAAASMESFRNPLRSSPLEVRSLDEPDPKSGVLPKYIGYINIGERPIAIIEGEDYRVGETIESWEYKLTSIHPKYVELLLNGSNDTIKVPLEKLQNKEKPQ